MLWTCSGAMLGGGCVIVIEGTNGHFWNDPKKEIRRRVSAERAVSCLVVQHVRCIDNVSMWRTLDNQHQL